MASNAVALPRHVKALALCHEGRILASHLHWDRDGDTLVEFEATLRKIFDSSGWRAVRVSDKRKLELREASSLYCLEIDERGRVYVAITTAAYPTRLVFSAGERAADPGPRLMSEFAKHVELMYKHESLAAPDKGLKRPMRPFLKTLASKFDDLESLDRISATEMKADRVKQQLHKALVLADERSRLLEETDDKMQTMAASARTMFNTATSIRSKQRAKMMRAWKRFFCCCGACCLFIVIAISVIAGLNYGLYHWFTISPSGISFSSSSRSSSSSSSNRLLLVSEWNGNALDGRYSDSVIKDVAAAPSVLPEEGGDVVGAELREEGANHLLRLRPKR